MAKVGEYKVAKGHGVLIVTFMAHRDPEVFPHPEEFMPERWSSFNQNDKDKLLGFGKGLHKCVGEKYMWAFLLEVTKRFVKEFKWDFLYKDKARKLKYLPVTRPAELQAQSLSLR